jgi:aldehyde dehydrogenase
MARSTMTPSPTTSTSRSASSARSSRGTSRSADGRLEARPGARGRQLRRAQAGGADPGFDHGADGAHRDLLPPGVLNVVNGFGSRPASRWPPAAHRQGRLHRRDHHRAQDHAVRAENLIPVTLELGGKSPNIFFDDVMAEDDAFFDKCLEGSSPCSPSTRARSAPARRGAGAGVDLRPVHRASDRPGREDRAGQPARHATMIGAQASQEQYEKILATSTSARRKAPRC